MGNISPPPHPPALCLETTIIIENWAPVRNARRPPPLAVSCYRFYESFFLHVLIYIFLKQEKHEMYDFERKKTWF